MTVRKKASLRDREAEIRRWASTGKDDEWIAGVLGSSPSSVQSFRSRRGIPLLRQNPRDARSRKAPAAGQDGKPHHDYEGVLEGDSVWFDAAVCDSELYCNFWRELREVEVRVGPERIGILPQRGKDYREGE